MKIFWNLPNILSLTRIAAVPVVLFLVWPGIENKITSAVAALIYAIAGLTDIADGAIARKRNQVTVFGKFFDPMVDKLFYIIPLIGLLQLPEPRISAWILMLIVTRELTITGLRGIAVSEGIIISASLGGKNKTAFATTGMCGLLIHYTYELQISSFHTSINFQKAGLFITYVALFYSLTSGFFYIKDFLTALNSPKKTALPHS